MGEIHIGPTEPGDAEDLVANLRAADAAELDALGATDHLGVIKASIANSTLCWSTHNAQGAILCIGGVAPLRPHLLLEHVGAPWLLGTELLFQYRRPLVTEPPLYIDQMLARYPELVNVVHVENAQSIRWLRRLGFTIHPPAPHGPRRALFHRFTMRASDHVR